jgi:hypothetical protein
MADQEQLKILKQGAQTWNKGRKENPYIKIDLTEADLRGVHLIEADLNRAKLIRVNLIEANLRGAQLIGADLSRADLRGAQLIGADLSRAKLYEADLSGANLYRADLTGAKLTGAKLTRADLTEADLTGADLLEADLSRANLYEADLTNGRLGISILGDNDLSAAIGLETIVHQRPSIIGLDTIRKSKGKIPIKFLRGYGLSDLEIEFAKLAAPGLDHEQVAQINYEIHRLYLDQPIQFYSCFISYNNKDQAFAQRLHDDLQNNGVRCWYAPEDMKIGDRIRPTIDHQIRLREKLLVILSENSIQSEWVGDEVEAAIEQEKESGKTVLFPIRVDDTVMNTRDDWAAKIKRRRNIGNFSTDYDKAFQRLLRDLKPQA